MSVPPLGDSEATIVVRERLRLLSIGFYVRGAMLAVFSCFMLIYVFMFLGMSFIPATEWNKAPVSSASTTPAASPVPAQHPANSNEPPVMVFRIIAAVMGAMMLLGWLVAGLTAYAGRCIQKRRYKPLIYVMAAMNCLFIPYGTLLGVFTFIVLGSPAGTDEFKIPAA